jgi:uncharacterized membrane protein (UPF0127 family)
MAYPIDVLHLDREARILGIETLPPWRLGQYFLRAAGVLEMRAGEARRLGMQVGEQVSLIRIETAC